MSNHYHLIIETLDGNLSKGMRQLNGVYSQASNRRHKRGGHLFQGRYKAILVDKDNYLLELARYVVLNPVRAKGMVRDIKDWSWSSYLAMIGVAPAADWLTTDWLLSQFGKQKTQSMEKYQQFVIDGIQDKLNIWSGLKGQIYLGDETFISNMQQKIGKEKDDFNIPKVHKCPLSLALVEIEKQAKGRNDAIITAYATGAYSQREIGEYFQLHPSTVGVIIRRNNDSQFAT